MSDQLVKRKSLKSNFIYNFASQILTLIVPLITTPYLARVLHETGNGIYSYSLSIITYFLLFANMGFDTYGQRQIAMCSNDIVNKSKVFWELFIIKIFFTLVSLIVLYSVLFSVGFGSNYNIIILILSIQVIAVPFDIQFLFRGDEDFKSIAIRTIIMRVIGIICVFLFVKDESDVWVYALCVSCSTIFANLIMWTTVPKKISIHGLGHLSLFKHIKPALLIFLPTLAITVYSVFDKTMIGLMAQNPDYENGCYEQAYKLNSVALLLVTVISSVMVSRNSHDYSVGDMEGLERHLYAACNYVWMVGLPLIVGFFVLSENLTSWFFGEGYAEVPLLLKIMSVRFVSSGFAEIFGSQLFIAIGKEKYVTISTIVAACVNLILNFFLIPIYGATGAAIATAICEITVTLIQLVIVITKKYLSAIKILSKSWKYIIAAGVMFVPIYFMQKYMPYAIWSFAVITLTGIVVYFLSLLVLRDQFFISNVKNVVNIMKNKIKKKKVEE